MHGLLICWAAICKSEQFGQKRYWPFIKPFRNISGKCCRCGGGGVCTLPYPKQPGPRSVGPGPAVGKRGRTSVSAGSQSAVPDPARRCDATRGRSSGNGGRVALQGIVRRDWRGLGRSAGVGLYRDQTAGAAIRGRRSSLLADPARHQSEFERGAGSLADRVAALGFASSRSNSPRRSAMAGRVVPLAAIATGDMGGDL